MGEEDNGNDRDGRESGKGERGAVRGGKKIEGGKGRK